MSEDNVLLPYIEMGVEAREQIMGIDGMGDAPITGPDHPFVKYAREFTHNLGLIAWTTLGSILQARNRRCAVWKSLSFGASVSTPRSVCRMANPRGKERGTLTHAWCVQCGARSG